MQMINSIKVAAIQLRIQPYSSFDKFAVSIAEQVEVAAAYGAKFILLPEFFSLGLVNLAPALSAKRALEPLIEQSEQTVALIDGLAKKTGSVVIGGSLPLLSGGVLRNCCPIASPAAEVVFQPKLHITPYEKEVWGVVGGDATHSHEAFGVKFGVAICYDVEFPEVPRVLSEQGMDLLFVPSWTDLPLGAERVRICSRAAAVSNQCYVISVGGVGGVPGNSTAHLNFSHGGVFSPIDHGFPRDGVVADTVPNSETIFFAELSLEALALNRSSGSVQLLKDRRTDLFSVTQSVKLG